MRWGEGKTVMQFRERGERSGGPSMERKSRKSGLDERARVEVLKYRAYEERKRTDKRQSSRKIPALSERSITPSSKKPLSYHRP